VSHILLTVSRKRDSVWFSNFSSKTHASLIWRLYNRANDVVRKSFPWSLPVQKAVRLVYPLAINGPLHLSGYWSLSF